MRLDEWLAVLQACKELGWQNWPYRKVKSVRKARLAVDTLEEDQLQSKDRVGDNSPHPPPSQW